MPPVSVATIALPQAIASSSDVPSPSVTELITNRSKPLMQPSTSVRNPGSSDVLLEPVLADLPLEVFAQLAFAENHEPRVRDFLHDQVRGVDRGTAGPCAAPAPRRCRRPAHGAGSQNASCRFTGSAAATCSTSMPSCTVTVRSAGMPSATSICRIASDAAMKQSTWRYFQRESELPFRWKSTRREATRTGAGGAARERQRERGHRDAVRIVGVHDVRPQPLDDARQTPGGRQVHLGPRRNRNQLEPLAGAPPQLAVRMRHQRGTMADLAQAVDGQQHLVLSAAPRAGGVDVEGEHLRGRWTAECSVVPVGRRL